MAFKNDKAKVWTKPELTKLGTLKDVAGPKTVSSNGASAGFANS
jgi:hypothetical protein